MRRNFLLALLLVSMAFDESSENDPFAALKRRFSITELKSNPYESGRLDGMLEGDNAGQIDAIANRIERDAYTPLSAPTNELKRYSEGFADGWNETYSFAYSAVINTKIKNILDDDKSK